MKTDKMKIKKIKKKIKVTITEFIEEKKKSKTESNKSSTCDKSQRDEQNKLKVTNK